ncbi:unnamed protein product [Caenorhabditis auriculariae]|uniref:Uncharacterized protein n=1 Tax=Caenorhabditis auriculariae TaxID=2777116 RepID=A0A8S1GVD5_9PELO|nr:unnamed protein product [Caenorhabditis auriculariae]
MRVQINPIIKLYPKNYRNNKEFDALCGCWFGPQVADGPGASLKGLRDNSGIVFEEPFDVHEVIDTVFSTTLLELKSFLKKKNLVIKKLAEVTTFLCGELMLNNGKMNQDVFGLNLNSLNL